MRKTGRVVAFALISVGLGFGPGVRAKAPDGGMRLLRFPGDRAVGTLSIQNRPFIPDRHHSNVMEGWVYFGEARGDVAVPAGAPIGLQAKSEPQTDFSFLSKLQPDDLRKLRIAGKCDDPDNRLMPHIAALTGLEDLSLSGAEVSAKGTERLRGLKSLKRLSIGSKDLGDDELARVATLESLEHLSVGGGRVTDAGLVPLAKLPALKKLNFTAPGVKGPGLAALGASLTLEELEVRGAYKPEGPAPKPSKVQDSNAFDAGAMECLAKISTLKTLDIAHQDITDEGLGHLAKMPNLQSLTLSSPAITARGLESLQGAPSLKELAFYNRGMTDSHFAALAGLKSLESLEFPAEGISESALDSLAGMRNLRSLRVLGLNLSDAGLEKISSHSSLEVLCATGNAVTDQGMARLAKLPKLRWLGIYNCPSVTDKGLGELAALKSLNYLTLTQCHATIPAVNKLSAIPHLQELYIDGIERGEATLDLSGATELRWLQLGAKIQDEDLACLTGLKNLEYLILTGGAITDQGIAHISGLESLETLTFAGGAGLTDAGLAEIAKLKRLDFLNVFGYGNYTDGGLKQLERLKNLQFASVMPKNAFSPEAVAGLKKALPKLSTLMTERPGTSQAYFARQTKESVPVASPPKTIRPEILGESSVVPRRGAPDSSPARAADRPR